MFSEDILNKFDQALSARSLSLEATVIGGAAMVLLGITTRQTRDVDVLNPELDALVKRASVEFAHQMRCEGVMLDDDWFNDGPHALTDVLPEEWGRRLRVLYQGDALSLTTLSRLDLLKTKLFALCDRGTDLSDCLAMAPALDEIDACKTWVSEQDAHPDWPVHVARTLDDLKRRLHGT